MRFDGEQEQWQSFLTASWCDGPLWKFNKTLRCSSTRWIKKPTIFFSTTIPKNWRETDTIFISFQIVTEQLKCTFGFKACGLIHQQYMGFLFSVSVFSLSVMFYSAMDWPAVRDITHKPLGSEYYLLELPDLKLDLKCRFSTIMKMLMSSEWLSVCDERHMEPNLFALLEVENQMWSTALHRCIGKT